jgi:hypothetical protein
MVKANKIDCNVQVKMKIKEQKFKYTCSCVIIHTQALGSVNQSLANLANLEHGGSLDVIPVLAGERINAR